MPVAPSGLEIIYMPIEGSMHISLFGGLHGTIRAGTYVHVRDGMRHEISSSDTQPRCFEWIAVSRPGRECQGRPTPGECALPRELTVPA